MLHPIAMEMRPLREEMVQMFIIRATNQIRKITNKTTPANPHSSQNSA